MQCNVMHTDGVRRRIKRRRFHAEPHDGQEVAFPHGLFKAGILRLYAAACKRAFRQRKAIKVGIKAIPPVCQRRFQRSQVCHFIRRQSGNLRQAVREHLRAEFLIERG